MKYLLLFLTCSIVSTMAFSQGRIIQFDKKVHDFGRIEKTNKKYKTTFTLNNVGDKAVVINMVNPSCGCTTSKFTRDSIYPGKSGTIEAEYDPLRGYTGPFSKEIYVETNYGKFVLRIKGDVYVKKSSYPSQFLVFDHLYKELGKQALGTVLKDTLIVYNKTQDIQSINKVIHKNGNFDVQIEEEMIPADSFARIFVSFTMDDLEKLGKSSSGFTVLTSDLMNPMSTIMYYHHLTEKFPKLTRKYLKQAPKLKIDHTEKDFGIVEVGSLQYDSFDLKNIGKDTLIIRKLVSPCSCLKFELKETVIAPGKSSMLYSTFDTVRRPHGENVKYLTIICNDPKRPEVALRHSYLIPSP